MYVQNGGFHGFYYHFGDLIIYFLFREGNFDDSQKSLGM